MEKDNVGEHGNASREAEMNRSTALLIQRLRKPKPGKQARQTILVEICRLVEDMQEALSQSRQQEARAACIHTFPIFEERQMTASPTTRSEGIPKRREDRVP
jgi:hypothetical protein